MEMWFDCLIQRKPGWIGRNLLSWYLFLIYGVIAFFALDGPAADQAQIAFFVILFPLICWPAIAAIGPKRPAPR